MDPVMCISPTSIVLMGCMSIRLTGCLRSITFTIAKVKYIRIGRNFLAQAKISPARTRLESDDGICARFMPEIRRLVTSLEVCVASLTLLVCGHQNNNYNAK